MIRTFKSMKFKLLSAVTLVFALSIAVTAAPAQAAANPYTPQEVCGSGYYVQRSHKIKGATVYQLYNGKYNCAVTIKTSSVGKATRVTAGLQVKGSNWAYDTGNYKYFAGPVKQYGKGKCVRYFGYHKNTNYTSPWGSCS